MKNLFTYLKALWSRVADSQSNDVGFDYRLTVGSPSGLDAKWMQNPFMRFAVVLTLIFTIGSGNVWGAAATLPVNYSFGDGKSSLPTGVTDPESTLGSNYATGNSPYRLKFDGNGDYIQIQVDAAAETITIGVKEFGTSGASIQIQGSTDGSSFTNIQTLSFSQGQNNTSSQSTSNSISSSYRYFRVKRNSGSNFGLGTLAITKAAASKTLSSISITTQPSTTKYLVGETFSSTGAVVTATYSDASTSSVSATWTPTTGLVSGSNTITASYTEGGVTRTATTTVTGYTVTVQVKDVDGNTLSGVGAPTASATGASITASESGNNYVFKRWVAVTAAGTSFADASNRSTTLSGTPTGAVTIKAEYYKPINITWNANGSAYTPGTPGTTQVAYGALMSSLTLPSPAPSTASFCGDKFVGWTTVEDVSQNDDTGLNLFTSVAGNSTAITEDMDFYAVFADYAN